MSNVKPIPEGANTITPYLIVEGADGLIEFTKRVFDAVEIARMLRPDGKIAHAEVRIGNSNLMLSEVTAQHGVTPAMLYVYVPDVDATYRKALDAGATSVGEPKNQFYGDRSAGVKDVYGNYWGIGTHVEDVTLEEMERRMKAMPAH